jgi:hypothetical protein
MLKKVFGLLLALVLPATLAGCGTSEPTEPFVVEFEAMEDDVPEIIEEVQVNEEEIQNEEVMNEEDDLLLEDGVELEEVNVVVLE